MPDLNTRKPAGHGCKNRQMSPKTYRSSSSTRSSVSCRSSVIQCTVCSKTFNNSSALAKHKLIHSDDRRYICSQCSKSFKRQDHLWVFGYWQEGEIRGWNPGSQRYRLSPYYFGLCQLLPCSMLVITAYLIFLITPHPNVCVYVLCILILLSIVINSILHQYRSPL